MNELILALLTIIPQLEDNPNGNPAENALGPYHIRPVMVQEVNRIMILKGHVARYNHEDALNKRIAKHMVTIHLRYWGKQFEKRTGRKVNIERLARIHNGGAFGPHRESTEDYGFRAANMYDDMQ